MVPFRSTLIACAVALLASEAIGLDPEPAPRVPGLRLGPDEELLATIDVAVVTSMEALEEAPLKVLSDEARIEARLRLRVEDAKAGARVVVATPEHVSIRRRFRLRAKGFLSEDVRDEPASVVWSKGDKGSGPPPWRFVLDPCLRVFATEENLARVRTEEEKLAVAKMSEVTLAATLARLEGDRQASARSARWALDGWLDPLDARQPDDAKLRRAGRWLELGPGLFGAPLLPEPGVTSIDVLTGFEAGEASLTNAFVVLVPRYRIVRAAGDSNRFSGSLVDLAVEGTHIRKKDRDRGERRPDRWLELARDDKALNGATGQFESRLDPGRGFWNEVRSTFRFDVTSSYGTRDERFTARARFERVVMVKLEVVAKAP